MKNNTIFSEIIKKKDNKKIIYQDKFVTAFNDLYPKAPVHIIIVTNKIIPTVNNIKKKDKKLIGHCIFISSKIAKMNNIMNSGYRLIINCNHDGGQEIFHFHIHLLGGKLLGEIIT